MAAIPAPFLIGGAGLNESHSSDGTSLLDVLNGFAYDLSAVKGSAPAAITAPAGTAVPAITAPAGTAVPTITAPLETTVPAHGVGAALDAYVDPATPASGENAADRTRLNELRTAVLSLHSYLLAVQTEVAQARSYLAAGVTETVQTRSYLSAFVTEIVALRAAQTTRAGLTLHWSAQAAYTP